MSILEVLYDDGDSNVIAQNMRDETRTVHAYIMHDDYLWDQVAKDAQAVWATELRYPRFNKMHACHAAANMIKIRFSNTVPRFINELWETIIDDFLLKVRWTDIAMWHLSNLWEGGSIDDPPVQDK